MLRGLLYRFPIMLKRLRGVLTRRAATPIPVQIPPASKQRRLERVIVADGVMRTLFDDYAEHRDSPRGDEEIGWILLGHWQDNEAIALAALPAGAERDASVGHVRFNSEAQALASRILREKDKRLGVIGVVHTHPGNMRSPSNGDFLGDSRWVGQLRSGEAIFGIGTADASCEDAGDANIYGQLCFSWYALAAGDSRYRPLPVEVQNGMDLARPLRPLWNTIETHAAPLNWLCRLFAKVNIEVAAEGLQKFISVRIGLAEPNRRLRLLLDERQARYYCECESKLIFIDMDEPKLDRAIHLILAELAKESSDHATESWMLVES